MKQKSQGSILFVVFFSVFLDLVGWGIIIPVTPFYAETLGASAAVVTLLGSSFSLMQFLFAPLLGRLSDRIGRRPVMIASIALSAGGFLLFGLSGSLPILFLARMLSGIGAANLGTAQAVVADSTPPEKRAKGMGLIGVAFGLGFTLGPAIGGFFVKMGLAAPAFAAAGLSAINFVLAWFLLPETYPPEKRAVPSPAVGHRPGISAAALRHAARHAHVGTLFFVFFTFATAFSLMEQVLGLYIEHVWAPGQYERAARLTSYSLMIIGITAIVVQGGLIGRLARAFGEGRLLRFGMGIVALSFFLIPLTAAQPFGAFLPLCSLMALGTGITNPSLMSLLSQSVGPDEQGTVLGLGQSLAALGRVAGPTVAGLIFQWSAPLPFLLGGALIAAAALVAFRLPARATRAGSAA